MASLFFILDLISKERRFDEQIKNLKKRKKVSYIWRNSTFDISCCSDLPLRARPFPYIYQLEWI